MLILLKVTTKTLITQLWFLYDINSILILTEKIIDKTRG